MFFLLAIYGFCGQAFCQEKKEPVKAVSIPLNQKSNSNSAFNPEAAAIPWDTGGNETVVRPESPALSGAAEKAETRKELSRINSSKKNATTGIEGARP